MHRTLLTAALLAFLTATVAAADPPQNVVDPALINRLHTEKDAALRSRAATLLGQQGSEACLTTLIEAANSDRTSRMTVGDIVFQSSARRAATFAIADWAARFSKRAAEAVALIEALPPVGEPDNENLADARLQACFQITRDPKFIAMFYEHLKSSDAKVRQGGVVAFRFLKLTQAPPQLLAAMNDSSPDVRSWAALVLGEIGDAEAGGVLMTAAANVKEDKNVRCNAIQSLGRIKLPAAVALMETLLTDPEPAVPGNAAVALYRITGRKVKEFPAGYNAD